MMAGRNSLFKELNRRLFLQSALAASLAPIFLARAQTAGGRADPVPSLETPKIPADVPTVELIWTGNAWSVERSEVAGIGVGATFPTLQAYQGRLTAMGQPVHTILPAVETEQAIRFIGDTSFYYSGQVDADGEPTTLIAGMMLALPSNDTIWANNLKFGPPSSLVEMDPAGTFARPTAGPRVIKGGPAVYLTNMRGAKGKFVFNNGNFIGTNIRIRNCGGDGGIEVSSSNGTPDADYRASVALYDSKIWRCGSDALRHNIYAHSLWNLMAVRCDISETRGGGHCFKSVCSNSMLIDCNVVSDYGDDDCIALFQPAAGKLTLNGVEAMDHSGAEAAFDTAEVIRATWKGNATGLTVQVTGKSASGDVVTASVAGEDGTTRPRFSLLPRRFKSVSDVTVLGNAPGVSVKIGTGHVYNDEDSTSMLDLYLMGDNIAVGCVIHDRHGRAGSGVKTHSRPGWRSHKPGKVPCPFDTKGGLVVGETATESNPLGVSLTNFSAEVASVSGQRVNLRDVGAFPYSGRVPTLEIGALYTLRLQLEDGSVAEVTAIYENKNTFTLNSAAIQPVKKGLVVFKKPDAAWDKIRFNPAYYDLAYWRSISKEDGSLDIEKRDRFYTTTLENCMLIGERNQGWNAISCDRLGPFATVVRADIPFPGEGVVLGEALMGPGAPLIGRHPVKSVYNHPFAFISRDNGIVGLAGPVNHFSAGPSGDDSPENVTSHYPNMYWINATGEYVKVEKGNNDPLPITGQAQLRGDHAKDSTRLVLDKIPAGAQPGQAILLQMLPYKVGTKPLHKTRIKAISGNTITIEDGLPRNCRKRANISMFVAAGGHSESLSLQAAQYTRK